MEKKDYINWETIDQKEYKEKISTYIEKLDNQQKELFEEILNCIQNAGGAEENVLYILLEETTGNEYSERKLLLLSEYLNRGAKLEEVNSELAFYKKRLQGVEEKNKSLRKEIMELKTKKRGLDSRLEKYQEQFSQAEEEKQKNLEQMNLLLQMQENLGQLMADNKELKERVKNFNSVHTPTEKKPEAGKVKTEIEEKKTEADKAKVETEVKKTEADKVKAETEVKKTEADKVKAETEVKKTEAGRTKAETEIKKTEADGAKAETETKKPEAGKVKAETETKKPEEDKAKAGKAEAGRTEIKKTEKIKTEKDDKEDTQRETKTEDKKKEIKESEKESPEKDESGAELKKTKAETAETAAQIRKNQTEVNEVKIEETKSPNEKVQEDMAENTMDFEEYETLREVLSHEDMYYPLEEYEEAEDRFENTGKNKRGNLFNYFLGKTDSKR